MSNVKYPGVSVQLTGGDGNAMVVLAKVRKALRRANVPGPDIDAFVKDATSGDYDHLLGVVMNTVEVS
jgi:hypothetical protein